ncbi:MAG: hypothetical protein OEY47_01395 [Candidatus Bathyarchaeota archaeon]|nr:hypothetical protein [Candidatus Bathyarchaeota archaeon]
MRKRRMQRSWSDFIGDILESIAHGERKGYDIACASRINFANTMFLLRQLVIMGYVELRVLMGKRDEYFLTEKGMELLKHFNVIKLLTQKIYMEVLKK